MFLIKKLTDKSKGKAKEIFEQTKDKKGEEAIKGYTQVIELDPNFFEAYYERARNKLSLKQYQEAIEDYRYAYQLKKNEHCLDEEGAAEEFLGNYESACNLYLAARTVVGEIKIKSINGVQSSGKIINKNYKMMYHQKKAAMVKIILGSYKEALEYSSEIISLCPRDSDGYRIRGLVNIILGLHKEAIEDFTQLIINCKGLDNHSNYSSRAIVHLMLGHYDEAIQDFQIDEKLNAKNIYTQFCQELLAHYGKNPDKQQDNNNLDYIQKWYRDKKIISMSSICS